MDETLRADVCEATIVSGMSETELMASLPEIEGHVDSTKGRTISGWLRDLDESDSRLTIQVVSIEDGQVLAEALADEFREDLLAAGIGDGRHGFKFTVGARSSETLRADVCEARTGYSLGEVELLASPPEVQGRVDSTKGRIISGWLRDLHRPDSRLTVQVISIENGQVLAEAVADGFRADLLAAGIGDGRYAFEFRVGTRSSETIRANVYEATTGYRLGEVELLASPPEIRGRVDSTNGRTISGWVCDIDRSDTRLSIQVISIDDGQILAETVADELRADLLAAGIGDGRHGFETNVNARINETLQADVYEAATGYKLGQIELPESHLTISTTRKSKETQIRLLSPYFDTVAINKLHSDDFLKVQILYYDILTRYKLFDDAYYKNEFMGSEEIEQNPLLHYLKFGSANSVKPNPYFDPREYLANNQDVIDLGIDPIIHYFLFGWNERRIIGEHFDAQHYVTKYADVRDARINPLYHFLAFGQRENRLPTAQTISNSEIVTTEHGLKNRGRIIMVSHDFNVGGAQQLLRTLALWIKNSTKFDICFVTMQDGGHRHLFEAIAPVYILPNVPTPESKSELQEFVGTDVQMIFVNSVASVGFFDYWEHNTPAICYLHELQKIIDLFPGSIELLNSRCSAILGGSEAVTTNLRDNHKIDPDKIELIYDFIDRITDEGKSPEKSTNQRTALGVPEDSFLVMGCGVMHWRKAPDKFIEVAELVVKHTERKCHFVWIGGGPDEDLCRKMIKDKNLDQSVSLVGYRENVPELIEAADLFLLPSEEDPFPLVCLFAAAKEIPIVCFQDAGGMPEFVEKGCGAAVPFGDVEEMAKVTIEYADNPDRVKAEGKFAIAAVKEKFTIATAGPRILDIMRKSMGKQPHVSVIVPNYNYANYLKERLSTIYEQTFQDFEVILLDDASSDNSAEILEKWSQRHQSTRLLVNSQNSGTPFSQWLKGIELANSELIWVAEADDFCEPNLLSSLVAMMDDRNVFIAHSKSVPVSSEGVILGDYDQLYLNRIADGRWAKSYKATDHQEIDAGMAIGNVIPNASAVIFRRFTPDEKFVSSISSMRMCGDWYFYLRALLGGDIAFHSSPLNYHRRHQKTVTSQTEGSHRYFDELAEIRRYVSQNFRFSSSTQSKSKAFTTQDLDRFKVLDEETRQNILNSTLLESNKTIPTVLVIISDLSPGGGQMFGIRLANSWSQLGGRVVLLNVGKFPNHDKVWNKIDRRVVVHDARDAGFSFGQLINDYDIDVVHSSIWWSDRFVHDHIDELPNHVVWCVTLHGCYETLLNEPKIDGSFHKRFPEMLQRVDEWVYLAEKNIRVFDEFGWDGPLSKIANGFAIEPPAELTRESLGLRSKSVVLLLASRAIEQKGWLIAVEAVKRLNDAGYEIDLMLAGEGPALEQLRQEELPFFIHCLGHIDNVQDYIAVSDIGILPSYFVGESMPLVIIEMIAQAKPVIASDIGEIASMLTVNEGEATKIAGIIIPLERGCVSVSSLESAILSMMNSEDREAAGQYGYQIFLEKFTMASMLSNYSDVYARNLEKRRIQ